MGTTRPLPIPGIRCCCCLLLTPIIVFFAGCRPDIPDTLANTILYHCVHNETLQIWAVEPDTGAMWQVTTMEGPHVFPAWSPDGNRIAFACDRDWNDYSYSTEIYSAPATGTPEVRLTGRDIGGDVDAWPTWSPDGRKIAFTAQIDASPTGDYDERWSVFLMRADGSFATDLTPGTYSGISSWSPDGQTLACEMVTGDDWDIVLLSGLWGTNREIVAGTTANEGTPAWSPDGSKLAYSSDRAGDWNIYVMNADGTNVRQLTDDPDFDGCPSWSPDGSRIAFESNRMEVPGIYVMDADGSNQRLVSKRGEESGWPAWRSTRSAAGSLGSVEKIIAGDTQPGDFYGAALAADGETILVGAPGEDGSRSESGAVYFYVDDGSALTEETRVVPPSDEENLLFGFSVSVDGDTAVIGVPDTTDFADFDYFPYLTLPGEGVGSAYVVFEQDGWDVGIRLEAPDGEEGDGFGFSVAISGDIVAVGAPGDDEATYDAGAVWIFERTAPGVWDGGTKLIRGAFDAWVAFGKWVAVEGDLLSVRSDTKWYTYHRTGPGSWTDLGELASGPEASFSSAGRPVFLGSTLVVPAHTWDGGAVLLFEWNGLDNWLEPVLAATGGDDYPQFVGVANSHLCSGSGHGTVDLFPNVGNQWPYALSLGPPDIDETNEDADRFGTAIAVGINMVVVGNSGVCTPGGTDTGAIYVYR